MFEHVNVKFAGPLAYGVSGYPVLVSCLLVFFDTGRPWGTWTPSAPASHPVAERGTPQDVPKTPQDASRTPPIRSKTAQDAPRRAQDAPRGLQDALKTPKEASKTCFLWILGSKMEACWR